ncbi:hypothetical protein B0H13DRAFT_1851199 [Mycena leptocephala]|nr:hypothetical protein B0H13DRAFT_1851199 [Mycena leptocephala]
MAFLRGFPPGGLRVALPFRFCSRLPPFLTIPLPLTAPSRPAFLVLLLSARERWKLIYLLFGFSHIMLISFCSQLWMYAHGDANLYYMLHDPREFGMFGVDVDADAETRRSSMNPNNNAIRFRIDLDLKNRRLGGRLSSEMV